MRKPVLSSILFYMLFLASSWAGISLLINALYFEEGVGPAFKFATILLGLSLAFILTHRFIMSKYETLPGIIAAALYVSGYALNYCPMSLLSVEAVNSISDVLQTTGMICMSQFIPTHILGALLSVDDFAYNIWRLIYLVSLAFISFTVNYKLWYVPKECKDADKPV